jgi:prepilin-type N-terminal cleavage/methylation domain-containing protein
LYYEIISMKYNKGFTLVELMVAIAIIVILSLIVMSALSSGKDKGNDSKIQSLLKSMTNQAQLFVGTTGTSYVAGTAYAGSGAISGAFAGGTPVTGTLFNDTTFTNNSLWRLANSITTGTLIYYGWDGASPVAGGKWFFAATTSYGAICVDYTGFQKKFTGTAPTAVVTTWTSAAFTRANSTYYDCI